MVNTPDSIGDSPERVDIDRLAIRDEIEQVPDGGIVVVAAAFHRAVSAQSVEFVFLGIWLMPLFENARRMKVAVAEVVKDDR